MAVIDARIVVADLEFPKAKVKSITTIEEASILGSELRYNTMEATIYYSRPEGGTDLRYLRYGTPVYYYVGDRLEGKFYLDTISRSSAIEYQLNCISAIGLLERKAHSGQVYRGVDFKLILASIIGNSFPYTIVDLPDMKVWGWLPLDTARNNLRQLVFVLNLHIIEDENRDIVFTRYDTSNPTAIAPGDVYNEGSEDILQMATKITVTEHSFFYTGGEPKELFNNSTDYVVNDYVVSFSNAPIYYPSLSYTGDLIISEASENYAIVSGRGALYGVPYQHTTHDVVRNLSTGDKEYEVGVSDVTLISAANGETIADRLTEYYSSRIKVSADIRYNGESYGNYYSFIDAFMEPTAGFMSKIDKSVSSFLKAHCEFVTNYSANYLGNNFEHSIVLTGSGVWYPPSGVNRIRIIVIAGGTGGNGGHYGEAGRRGTGGNGGEPGDPGLGGRIYITTITNVHSSYEYNCGTGGFYGLGYNYDEEQEVVDPYEEYFEGQTREDRHIGLPGGATTFGGFNSNNGALSESGFFNIFDNKLYAHTGFVGVAGGKGGDGGQGDGPLLLGALDDPIVIQILSAENPDYNGLNGESVEYDGVTYSGGTGYARVSQLAGLGGPSDSETKSALLRAGGGGGGGAAVGATPSGTEGGRNHGLPGYMEHDPNGDTFTHNWSEDDNTMTNNATAHYITYGGAGGRGCTPVNRDRTSSVIYGKGGDGGHGGGGGGGYGKADSGSLSYTYEVVSNRTDVMTHTVSIEEANGGTDESTEIKNGGLGGDGGAGSDGCVIVYY